jgi:hypothetical protein
MPRGLNGTHRELSLTGAVASDIWRPPALQAREDPNTNGEYGSVRLIDCHSGQRGDAPRREPATQRP